MDTRKQEQEQEKARAAARAARLVTAAMLGLDYRTVVVAGKAYTVTPPTIRRIAGAAYHLSALGEGSTLRDALLAMRDAEAMARSLSWLIQGDDGLATELSGGTMGELLDALEAAYSLISPRDFSRLSALARNVARLAATPRQ